MRLRMKQLGNYKKKKKEREHIREEKCAGVICNLHISMSTDHASSGIDSQIDRYNI